MTSPAGMGKNADNVTAENLNEILYDQRHRNVKSYINHDQPFFTQLLDSIDKGGENLPP